MTSRFRRLKFRKIGHYNLHLYRLKLINNLVTISIIAAVSLFIFGFVMILWISKDLPLPDKVKRKSGFSIVVVDRNDKPVYDIYTDKNRIPISLSDVPEALKQATIAVEDKDFYKHQGFDPKGILRAVFNIITFRGIQGGSTLTQQLVKNVLLSSERTITRKFKEFLLAVQIERKYTKDEILQMYLNESPYGGTMWGIESAAEGYFGKHAKDLDVIESAFLAGMPQRPSYYSPFGSNSNAYIKRTEEVLRRMREDNYISPTQEFDLKRQLSTIKFASDSAKFIAPHFVMYVKRQLVDRFGEKTVEEGGLKVYTTLDRSIQEKSEMIIKEELDKLKKLKVSNGAIVVINPKSGEILSYIGSKEYDSEDVEFEGKFDVASMGLRQPGSVLKPITYAAAFMKNYTPGSLIMDTETHFPAGSGKPDYIPKNYDNKFRGPVLIRPALANSINVPAVKMTALVGIREILKTSYDMGLGTLEPTDDNVNKLGLSLTLGGGEVKLIDLVSAFGVFATGGVRNDIYSINKVVDNTGKILYEHYPVSGKRVLGEDVSFLVSDILSDNQSRKEVFGLNSYLVIPGRTVAVKTGTTDDKRDNWTVGYTQSIVAGVWVGNNDNSPMDPKLASGVTGAAPIWNRVIKEALKKIPDEPFRKPDNIIEVSIDSYGGGLPREGKPTRSEFFIKGTEPMSVSAIYQKIKLSKSDNNKLANPIEILNGSYDEKDFLVFREDDPTSSDEKNRWQESIDAWISSQNDPLFHPPTDIKQGNEQTVAVRIKNPQDKTQIDSNSLDIIAEARALKDIKKMELYIDDSLRTTVNTNILTESLNLESGIHKIKVKAQNISGDTGESEITVGIKVSPNAPSAATIPTAVPTVILLISPSPSPSILPT